MLGRHLYKHPLETLFNPKSIAVVGASNATNKIGGFVFSQILKSSSKAYPINVKWKEIQGQKAYTRLDDLPEIVDVAIVAIPSVYVLDTIEKCGHLGINNIVIISAGFKEASEEGKRREEKLKQLIKKYQLNVVGPNCLGFLNPHKELNCSFAKDLPIKGDVALVSQSGAVIDAIIDWSFKHRLGFSKVVSLGNMAGVDELQLLKYLQQDSQTKAIVFYIETLEKGDLFAEVLREISKTKPVIIINPGKSTQAQQAIGSHTGSLAQNNTLAKTLLLENNAIIAETIEELYDLLIGLQAKIPKGKNTVIVTNAGGPGVITTDALSESNFNLAEIPNSIKQQLTQVLPPEASLKNPIDILGDAPAQRYKDTLKILSKDEKIDNIVVLLTPQMMTNSEEIAKEIILLAKKSKKTIVTSFLGDKALHNAFKYFDYNHFANFQTPSQAIKTLNKLYQYHTFEYEEKIPTYHLDEYSIEIIREKLKGREGLLDYTLTQEVLNTFAISLPQKLIFNSISDVLDTELTPGKNYVLKVDGIVHKKDIGGVKLGINNLNFKDEAINMFDHLSGLHEEFYLTLEEEVKGVEVIIGLKSDKELGNFIMFGWGGTYVSLLNDISFSTCPLSYERADKLLKKSKVYPLLKGYRGSKEVRLDHLLEVMVRISYLQFYFPEIKEVDINPVIANENGIFLVDVKLLV